MPDFSSKAYWDERFTKDNKPFDWLVPAAALRDVTADVWDTEDLPKCEILHIGCGTSDASVLRGLVETPQQILNLDYSDAAVQAASEREQELLIMEEQTSDLLESETSPDDEQRSIPLQSMRWSCLDLLSLDSTLSLLERQRAECGKLFDLVLDKSTSDSIASGRHVSLNVPYPLSINGWTRRILRGGLHAPVEVHPLHVLALHLAALTRPGSGRWVVISYSEDRFPFLPPFPHSASTGLLGDDVIQKGFTHPHQLWKLEKKEKLDLDARRDETLAQRRKRLSMGIVYRPQPIHWLYVLRRTQAIITD
ncbi:uncharacterized protein RCC_05728 [Ramularia collo-cygni]|uniref:Methyltransferase domain-containing protein n=1 Tax=Ramularia collo-cygni TaxID=112498 RepID=A0A2D3URQ8_9PEZI|nr:uncharacterized protein RCC_05728 [Ramularia collo-cygni]CZT19872.1 uncharacterized protein RCC_05728 [Ramularia collo-cygni]